MYIAYIRRYNIAESSKLFQTTCTCVTKVYSSKMHALHLTSSTVQALVEGDQSRGGAVGAWRTFLGFDGAARAVEAGRALVRLLAQIRRGAVGVLATEIAETGCDVTHVRTRKIYVMLHQHTCTKKSVIANDAVNKLTRRCRCRCSQSAPLRHSRSRPGTGYSRIPSPDRCGSSTYLAGTGTRTRCVCRPDTSNLYSLTTANTMIKLDKLRYG